MNKKVFLAGGTLGLAGIAVYRYLSAKNAAFEPGEVWTTESMPDLTGKVIIVTGANSGIGYETAKEFARKGAQTVLACRNMDKAQAALKELQAEIPETPAEIMHLELSSQASVRQFADEFKSKYDRLNVLVNNAGIMMVPYGTTEDDFENQFGTNHLGHFALTGLLIDLLLETAGSRVVNVSSTGHRWGEMDFDNLMYAGGLGYSSMGAYGRSKLANLLFTFELQRRYERFGADAIAVAAHPGISATNLTDHMINPRLLKVSRPLMARMVQSAAMGALPTIRAAVDPNVQGGEYFGPNGPGERGGYPVIVPASEAAHDEDDARKLWQVSKELTGVQFGPIDQ
jgi:NAD(P)-dependent dehydrogenase (short-subunit alcohol dehydrogenase family)